MPQDLRPQPIIDERHFSALFEQKRYYISGMTSVIAAAAITKDDLLTAKELDPSISSTVVKAFRRGEPVYLHQANAFVQVINRLLAQRGAAERTLPADDAIAGAFFVIRDFEKLMSERSLTSEEIAKATDYPKMVIDGARAGKRLTLTTALDLVASMNEIETAPWIDPTEVITSDPKVGKKAAASQCRAKRSGYDNWPPKTLNEEDNKRGGRPTNLRVVAGGKD